MDCNHTFEYFNKNWSKAKIGAIYRQCTICHQMQEIKPKIEITFFGWKFTFFVKYRAIAGKFIEKITINVWKE